MLHEGKQGWLSLVDEFLVHYSGDWEDETFDWYRVRLAHFVEFVSERGIEAEEVDANHLNEFKGMLKRKGYSYSTRKGTLGALKTFMTWLYRKRRIKANPFHDPDYRPPRKERRQIVPVATHHARLMIRAAEADRSAEGKRDSAMMRLMLTAGLRRKEVVSLRVSDIDFHHNRIFVLKGGKYNNQRFIPLKLTTKTAILEWLKVRPAPRDGDWLFIRLNSGKGKYRQMRPRNVARIVEKWAKKAGVPVSGAISPHKWRHAFGTSLSRGKNPFGLQALMGHSDIATTSGYVHSDMDELTDLVEGYAPDVDDTPDAHGS
jgi:site-specific recombinase XerD